MKDVESLSGEESWFLSNMNSARIQKLFLASGYSNKYTLTLTMWQILFYVVGIQRWCKMQPTEWGHPVWEKPNGPHRHWPGSEPEQVPDVLKAPAFWAQCAGYSSELLLLLLLLFVFLFKFFFFKWLLSSTNRLLFVRKKCCVFSWIKCIVYKKGHQVLSDCSS